jgi:hypothetical protein
MTELKKQFILKERWDGHVMNEAFWKARRQGCNLVAFTHEGKRRGRVVAVDPKKPRVQIQVEGFVTKPWIWFMPDSDGKWFLGTWRMKSCREKGYSGWKHWRITPLGMEER